MAGMRIAIVGSRTFNNGPRVRRVIERLHDRYGKDLTIVSGGARGVDSMAENVAKDLGVKRLIFPAEWDRFGRSAGYRRNETIVANSDIVIVFFARGPRSKGSSHTMNIAVEAGKPTFVYHEGEWYSITKVNGSQRVERRSELGNV